MCSVKSKKKKNEWDSMDEFGIKYTSTIVRGTRPPLSKIR